MINDQFKLGDADFVNNLFLYFVGDYELLAWIVDFDFSKTSED